ncbi:MAG: aminotransferase class III-fold pyridoxal phosphate-dependent enzyme, partial [Eubacteriaceae bacterium]|nr:aminotransferase class III-fold pyridoxal phosphate-dependent enzyme [Eubacteriaceae bacterium]
MKITEKADLYMADAYKRSSLAIVSGHGAIAVGEDGSEYIDMGSGISVNAFGYSDEELAQAVYKQMTTLTNTSNIYYTEPQAQLAQWLCEKTGMKKVFFSNSGAEANECAIKAARKYSADKYGDSSARKTIVSLENSFHGRTLATLAATGQESMHTSFGPFPDGFRYAKPNSISSIKEAFSDGSACALILEVVQGEGGVAPLDLSFVQQAEEEAKARDILFIIDEIQSGNGRTGTLFAYEQYGCSPDVVTTAKALGGGLPIGATLFSEKTKNVLSKGSHGSTFGGNPICCAAALSVAARLTDSLFNEVREKGQYIRSELEGLNGVEAVTGIGLFIGVKTVRPAGEIMEELQSEGVLALTAKDRLRLLPPLNIPMDILKKA